MGLAWHLGAAATDQEIEVAALIGLEHMIEIELLVTARHRRRRRRPGGAARLEFLIGHLDLEAAFGDIEDDHIALLHQRQRTAGGRLRRDVQDDGAIGGAAHARVRDPHHVGDPFLQDLGRQAQISDFGHARISLGAAVLEHHDRAFVDVQRRIVDALVIVFDGLEDDGAAPVTHQIGARRRRLEHGAIGRQIAAQHGDAAAFRQRLVERADHLGVVIRRIGGVLPDGLAVHRRGVAVEQTGLAKGAQHRRQAAGVIIVLHQEPPRRHQIDDGRHIAPQPVPVVERKRNTDASRQRQQMDDGVGRSADGAVDANGVLERFGGEDLRHAQVLAHHLDDAPPG